MIISILNHRYVELQPAGVPARQTSISRFKRLHVLDFTVFINRNLNVVPCLKNGARLTEDTGFKIDSLCRKNVLFSAVQCPMAVSCIIS